MRHHHRADAVEPLALRASLRQHRVKGVLGRLHLAAVLADGVGLVDDELLEVRVVGDERLPEMVEGHPREDLQLRALAELRGAVGVQRVALGHELIDGILFRSLAKSGRHHANRQNH